MTDPQHATPDDPEHRDVDAVFAAISAVSGAHEVPLSVRDAMARAAAGLLEQEIAYSDREHAEELEAVQDHSSDVEGKLNLRDLEIWRLTQETSELEATARRNRNAWLSARQRARDARARGDHFADLMDRIARIARPAPMTAHDDH